MKLVSGLLVGVFIGWFIGVFVFSPYRLTEQRLVERWRMIQPGDDVSSLAPTLGDWLYKIEVGGAWPGYATEVFPESLSKEHGLAIFIVEGWGPHLLYVVFDKEEKVTFVSSGAT